jgi:hypothetical protein
VSLYDPKTKGLTAVGTAYRDVQASVVKESAGKNGFNSLEPQK